MDRARWSSRSTFIMASIGSAVGLGNAWRFPGVAYQNGGGAFLIPYLIAMFTAGVPILALEVSIGKRYQCGAPAALRQMNKKFEWIGWFGVGTAFVIAAYYAVVVAWVIDYIGLSFTAPWIEGDTAQIFLNRTLQTTGGMFRFGGFSWMVLGALALGWLLIYWCIRHGVHSVGKIVNYTVVLPVVLLVVLIVRAVTLPGAWDGLAYYLVPDWSRLADPAVWAAAYGQAFFSLSILFAIMFAYGSYLPKTAQVPADSLIIAGCDAGISFLSGLAAFGALGYLSQATATPIGDMNHTGVMLAFVTYPSALAQMPGGRWMVVLFSLVFFIMLFTLAIDSAFSIVEAVITAFVDRFGWNKSRTTKAMCAVGFLASLLFATRAGFYWLDITDHFVNDFNLILTGLFECIALGWVFGAPKLLEFINQGSTLKFGRWWCFCIRYLCPAALLLVSGAYLYANLTAPYNGYPAGYLAAGGWAFVVATLMFGVSMPGVARRVRERRR